MTVDRTELEWIYEPKDFFEAPYRRAGRDFELKIDSGTALATLIVPTDPVPADLEESVRTLVENTFSVRELQLHRKAKLEGPRIYQHSAGRKDVSIRLEGVCAVGMIGQLDVIVSDGEGNIKHDSKAERIAENTSLLDLLAPKLQQSALLQSLVVSYSKAIDDPDDEFTHLYEVRDALSNHYGSDENARRDLGISKSDWSRFGVLTNVEPLEQGRHRGNHPHGRRQATDEELDETRNLARQWIIAFAQTV
jgi:hypothetical protein